MKIMKMNDGNKIPILGLGTWELRGQRCVDAVKTALEIGYRHIDTAAFYQNHREIAQAIKESGINRGEIFITSKVRPTNLRYDDVLTACDKALNELESDYIDLYLVHWPNHSIPIEETTEAFKILLKEGKIKSAGVSNFEIDDLEEALKAGFPITNDQIEYNPSEVRDDIKEFCDKHQITVTAYSPLGTGSEVRSFHLKELAEKYQKSIPQIIIRWIIQKGIIAIPKASSREHLEENFDVFDWEISKEDIKSIAS